MRTNILYLILLLTFSLPVFPCAKDMTGVEHHRPDWAGFLMHEAHSGSKSIEAPVFWCGTPPRHSLAEALAVVSVPDQCSLRLELWTPEGSCLWQIPTHALPEMAQTFAWSVAGLPKGLYLLRLEAPTQTLVAKWLHS